MNILIISVYCGDIIIYGFENNMPYHVHDRPFIPMPLLYKLVGGESDSRVPHNSYENVTYSSRKQSECTMIDQCCIMPVRGLERQLNTPYTLISPMQTYRTHEEIGQSNVPHCLLSREPRRLRQMLILTMLVEI